jgi:hypothetical protein
VDSAGLTCARRCTVKHVEQSLEDVQPRNLIALLNMKLYLLPCLLLTAVLCAQSTTQPALNAAEKQFQDAMNNVTMVGQSTVDGNPAVHEDRYVIERVSKVKDDLWNFDARMNYHGKEVKVAMPLPVKWAGDTAVISLTNFAFPGLGSYTARVVIYDGNYAGTWSASPTHGGKVFGKIVKNDAASRP